MHSTTIMVIGAYLAMICTAAPVPIGDIVTRTQASQEKRTELYCIGNNSARVSDEDGGLMQCSLKRENLSHYVNARGITDAGVEKRIELYSVGNNHAAIDDEDADPNVVNKRIELYSVGNNHAEIEEEDGVGGVVQRTELYCGNGVNNAQTADESGINPIC